MRRRIYLLTALALVTAATAYVSGRWAFFLLVPPVLIPGFLFAIVSLLVLVPRSGDASVWNRWPVRLAALAACWLLLCLPALRGDGYFEMGRRAHIRSLFSPELVAEIRAAATTHSGKTARPYVEMTEADLPPAVGGTGWGFPGHAHAFFDDQGKLDSVRLIWGAALIAHHGLVISEKPIPFRGYGFHGGDSDAPVYPERYYPLHPGSYILIDEN